MTVHSNVLKISCSYAYYKTGHVVWHSVNKIQATLQMTSKAVNKNEKNSFNISIWHGLFEPSVMEEGGGGHEALHHNFAVMALMIMKFGTGINIDVFYTMATKRFVTSLLLRNYDVITCSRWIDLNFKCS